MTHLLDNEIDTVVDGSRNDNLSFDHPPVGSQPAGGLSLPALTQAQVYDAAWWYIKHYIQPWDCNFKHVEGDHSQHPEPCNQNHEINAAVDDPRRWRYMFRLDKAEYIRHLKKEITYYFRSKTGCNFRDKKGKLVRKGIARAGHGRSSKTAQKLPFAQHLGITTGLMAYAVEGTNEPYLAMLLGQDLDAHDGQRDVWNLNAWVLDTFFPGRKIYWEPSTNGDGIHQYFVLFYRRCHDLRYMKSILRDLSQIIIALAAKEGFEAKPDYFRGFPTLRTKGYVLKGDRSDVIKLPRFQKSSSVTNITDIAECVQADYVLFDDLVSLVDRYRSVLSSSSSVDSSSSSSMDTVVDPLTDTNQAVINDIDTLLVDRDGESDGSEIEKVAFGTEIYPPASPLRSMSAYTTPPSSPLDDELEALKPNQCPDACKRAWGYCALMARRTGRVPTLEEALTGYKKHGLGTGEETPERIRRFQDVLATLERTHDNAKCKGNRYAGFESEEGELIRRLTELTNGVDMNYKYKSKQTRTMSLDELAYAYFIMKRQQRNEDSLEFGYEYMIQGFQGNGRPCNRWLACKLFKVLKEIGAIEMTKDYHWSRKDGAKRKARRWQVKDILTA